MRKALSLTTKAAVSGLLLYFALDLANIETVRDRLRQIDPRWIALGLLLLLIQAFVLAIRWDQIVIRCGTGLSLGRSFRYTMIATFFNQTLPSSIGGDAIRIWLVGRHSNWRTATYSVFLDRVVGVIALAGLVVICLPWTLELVHDLAGRVALLLIGFGSFAAGLVFISAAWKPLRILQRWSLTRHLAAAATVAVKILRTPSSLVPIVALSVLIHLLTVLAAWCAARSVGANVPLLYLLFLVLPVILVAIIPISIAGWGVREGAMVAAFASAGLPQNDGLIVSLLFGVGYLVLGVAGGVVWITSNDRGSRVVVPSLQNRD
jgi:uncharacterized protein (TIRG00374 family)